MTENVNSQTLLEQLKNSLLSITIKFEELQKMYDKLMESINSKESFQQIKKLVKPSKSSLETIDLDNLDKVKNLKDAQRVFTKFKVEIQNRDEEINKLKVTIDEVTKKNANNEVTIKKLQNTIKNLDELCKQKLIEVVESAYNDKNEQKIKCQQKIDKLLKFLQQKFGLEDNLQIKQRINIDQNGYDNVSGSNEMEQQEEEQTKKHRKRKKPSTTTKKRK